MKNSSQEEKENIYMMMENHFVGKNDHFLNTNEKLNDKNQMEFRDIV